MCYVPVSRLSVECGSKECVVTSGSVQFCTPTHRYTDASVGVRAVSKFVTVTDQASDRAGDWSRLHEGSRLGRRRIQVGDGRLGKRIQVVSQDSGQVAGQV